MNYELIGALVGAFGVLSAIAGLLVRIGRAKEQLKDHERRITRLEADDDAEEIALRQRGADA